MGNLNFYPGVSLGPKRCWTTAQALYALRVAAGRRAKPPKFPGRIVFVSRATVEELQRVAKEKEDARVRTE